MEQAVSIFKIEILPLNPEIRGLMFNKNVDMYVCIYIYIYIYINIRWASSVLNFNKRGQETWEIRVEIQLRPPSKSVTLT